MKKIHLPARVLIVDDIDPVFMDTLAGAGFSVDYRPDFNLQDTLACIEAYHALVLRSKFKVTPDLIDRGLALRAIARAGAGVDNIDVAYAESKGITLVSAPEGNCDAVAEHMLGMLLVLMHQLRQGDRQIREGRWLREENRGTELMGKTVGLIGYGNNGQAMARKLSGMGVRVLAYDKYRKNYSDAFARQAEMDEIYAQAEVLSLHVPLTQHTRQMVGEDYLNRFQHPLFFLNGSRGEIVQIPAVLRAIEQGRVRAAAFDVLPLEKFPALKNADWFNELIQNQKVLLSPHVAGWTVESYFKIAKILAGKLVKALSNS